jgi:glycosyltransferase involved in cell wall biosynthesis
MAQVKVLHLIPTLSGGGAERQLANLVCSTSRQIVEHVVCTIHDPDFFGSQIRNAGYEVIDLGITQKRPFVKAAAEFRRILKRQKPDAVHSWLYDANIVARLALLTYAKTPLITSLQLADYEPEAARIGNWNPSKVRGLRYIDQLTAKLTDPHFVPCSEFVAKSYRHYFGMRPDRATVIPNSFDPNFLLASGRSTADLKGELGLPEQSFVYLNVARLDPQKNQRTVIEAFHQVAGETPNSFLLLAGTGSLEQELRSLAREGDVGHRIRFLGRRSDIGDLLELADVFVFPSFFEGLPVALIEAMSKRLPCIASDVDVFREVIADGKTGVLIDPESAERLAKSMLRLYDSEPLRERLGEAAYKHASSHFSVGVTAPRWEEFYQRISAG